MNNFAPGDAFGGCDAVDEIDCGEHGVFCVFIRPVDEPGALYCVEDVGEQEFLSFAGYGLLD